MFPLFDLSVLCEGSHALYFNEKFDVQSGRSFAEYTKKINFSKTTGYRTPFLLEFPALSLMTNPEKSNKLIQEIQENSEHLIEEAKEIKKTQFEMEKRNKNCKLYFYLYYYFLFILIFLLLFFFIYIIFYYYYFFLFILFFLLLFFFYLYYFFYYYFFLFFLFFYFYF
jgi:hypothetical protein